MLMCDESSLTCRLYPTGCTNTYVYTIAYTHAYYIHTYIHIHIHKYMPWYTHAHTCTQQYLYIFIHTYIHTCTHTCIQIVYSCTYMLTTVHMDARCQDSALLYVHTLKSVESAHAGTISHCRARMHNFTSDMHDENTCMLEYDIRYACCRPYGRVCLCGVQDGARKSIEIEGTKPKQIVMLMRHKDKILAIDPGCTKSVSQHVDVPAHLCVDVCQPICASIFGI
jgi:hypothetical protein